MRALGVLLSACAAAAFGGERIINFDSAAVGAAPAGWTVAMTHKGAPKWEILKDDSAPRGYQSRRSDILSQPGLQPIEIRAVRESALGGQQPSRPLLVERDCRLSFERGGELTGWSTQ